jgi:hypothetical protein
VNLVYTVLAAFPIGFLLSRRQTALLTYLLLGAYLFSFQTLGVLLSWLADEPPVAFGPSPTSLPVTYSESDFWGYGAINLLITAAGVGLVLLGHRTASRRRARRGRQDVVSVQ